MDKDKDEYFDIEGVEGDEVPTPTLEEVEATLEAEQEAVAEVAKELSPEPSPPMTALSDHATSAAAGGKYPTEDPGDDTTVWSPRPGVIGRNNQGFRKIR